MTEQRNLFRMPVPRRIGLSLTQREVLAWVEFSQGQYTAWPRRFQTATLRSLMAKQLVKCVALSPARYLLTPLGRAVRSRYGSQGVESRRKPPLVTQMFFKDADE
jgi:hypothetical protein